MEVKKKLEIAIHFSLLSSWRDDELNVHVERALGFTGDVRDVNSQPISRHEVRTIEVDVPEYMMESLMASSEDERSDEVDISTFMEIKVSGVRDVTKAECRLSVCPNCGKSDWTERTVWTEFVDGCRSHIDNEWFTCVRCDTVVHLNGKIFRPNEGLTLK